MLPKLGSGSGSALPPAVLAVAGVCTVVATAISFGSIILHLKSYRKPGLQRMVVRIMLMVPLYAVASFISLFSLQAAFVIDALRDIYEAFVIYCFFHLLLAYLGGERSLLILLYGRPPKQNVFPATLFKREIDMSDPFTFLNLKRGIFQYVQVKPILAIVTLILKATGNYNEGDLRANSGYLYVSIIYNASICLSLYCLGMFWVCINDDIKPFRPVPKFLCVKLILFAVFWQSLFISILVAAKVITKIGPYTDSEHISLAIGDTLICFEMPLFAIAHMYAFSHTDYIDKSIHYAGRMPFYYAVRDAFGLLDVLEDGRATIKGGFTYRTFEPVEGGIHYEGSGRERRIQAGLRYSKGGKKKYWLPMPAQDAHPSSGPLQAARRVVDVRHGYAPLLEDQVDSVLESDSEESVDEDGTPLRFDSPDEEEEDLYANSRKLLFGDYNYPCIDASTEDARQVMWDVEERILRDQRAAAFSSRGVWTGSHVPGYGAVDIGPATRPRKISTRSRDKGKNPESVGLFGELAEEEESSSSHHPRRTYTPPNTDVDPSHAPPQTIIDYAHDKLPDLDLGIGGLRLQWQKQTGGSPRPSPLQSPGSVKSSPSRPTPRRLGHSKDSTPSTPPSNLPPDAVDLVVEDPHAAEEAMAWERKKGDPALRVGAAGSRRVYRRQYVTKDEQGNARNVEIEEEEQGGPPPDDKKVKVKESAEDEREVEVTEFQVARAESPPPHANVEAVTQYRYTLDDPTTNPWA